MAEEEVDYALAALKGCGKYNNAALKGCGKYNNAALKGLGKYNNAALKGLGGRVIKGSEEAKKRMAYLRSLRGKGRKGGSCPGAGKIPRTKHVIDGGSLFSALIKAPYKIAKGGIKAIKWLIDRKKGKGEIGGGGVLTAERLKRLEKLANKVRAEANLEPLPDVH